MENESSTKWCELTFVQACPTLENYKQKTALGIKLWTQRTALGIKLWTWTKQNLIDAAKFHGGHAVQWTLTVSFQSPWFLSPRNIDCGRGFTLLHWLNLRYGSGYRLYCFVFYGCIVVYPVPHKFALTRKLMMVCTYKFRSTSMSHTR